MVFIRNMLSAAAVLALAGCASIAPMEHGSEKPVSAEQAKQALELNESWNAPAVVQEGKASVVLLSPYAIPDDVRKKKISLELEPGATIKDVVAILGKLGIPVIVSDEEVAGKAFYLPHFKGNLGTLLSAVTRATDVWFTWSDGTIVVAATERIGVSMPQENGFSEQLTKGLEALGVKERAVTWQAGLAVMEITPSQFRKVRTYLERMTANAAIVSLQVAVVNVTLNQNVKQGIDWDKLQLQALSGGGIADLKAWQTATAPAQTGTIPGTGVIPAPTTDTGTTTPGTTTGGTTTPTTGSGTNTTAQVLRSVAATTLTGSGLTGAFFNSRFSFSGLFNYLQTYGDAETKQNVVLKTVAGNKVEFKSLMQIPYVEEVGVTTATATTGTVAGATTGSTKTAKADDGISVEMTPMYDAAANSVTIDLKLSIKAVVAFNELSAGNQIGKLTQPTTADRSLNDTLRLRPGETVVVGGLTYDSISNNKGAPPFLQGTKYESQSLTVNRQTMFIVVRPTVVRLGQVLVNETGDALELMPGGTMLPEPEVVKKPASKVARAKNEE